MRNLKAEYNVATRKDVKFIIIKSKPWLAEEADVLGLLAGGDVEILDRKLRRRQGHAGRGHRCR